MSAPIQLRGVTTNNLKNIDIDLLWNKLTIVTGVSGSGKSSLVFQTLLPIAQEKFAESFPSYIRNYLKLGTAAEIDSAEGVGPCIAISRKHRTNQVRSVVATMTGVYDLYRIFYSRFASYTGNVKLSAAEFSFNNTSGACECCEGLGIEKQCDHNVLISDPTKSILNGAFNGTKAGKKYGDPYGKYLAFLKSIEEQLNLDFSIPYNQLGNKEKGIIWNGTQDLLIDVVWNYKNKTREGIEKFTAKWSGLDSIVKEDFYLKKSGKQANPFEEIVKEVTCSICKGQRLKQELNQYLFQEKSIGDLLELTSEESIVFWEEAVQSNCSDKAINELTLLIGKQVLAIFSSIVQLKVDYLEMNRSSKTLSGGEFQRLMLAGKLNSGLSNITYLLDEPMVGLHKSMSHHLMNELRKLVNLGNTVILVEHDLSVLEKADQLIEIGPYGGVKGGEVIAVGSYEDLKHSNSLTGSWVTNPKKIDLLPTMNKKGVSFEAIQVHHMKGFNFDLYLNNLICISGPSGSGKSVLLKEVIYEGLKKRKLNTEIGSIQIHQNFDDVIFMSQNPIRQSRISTVASFLEIADFIRAAFFKKSKQDGKLFKKTHFSHQHKDGKCAECNGIGKVKTNMDYLADIWTECELCEGLRYSQEVLSWKIDGLSIGEILNFSDEEALSFWRNQNEVYLFLNKMKKLGLSYLKLNQGLSELSGGEMQRLGLVKIMLQSKGKKNIYLLDEPSAGLHSEDVYNLINSLKELIRDGHSVIYNEHHPMLIEASNQQLILGKGSGRSGGELVNMLMK